MARVFKSHPKLSWLITLLALAAAVMAILELTNITYVFHDKPTPHTASEYTKGGAATNGSNGTGNSDSDANSAPGGNKDSAGSGKTLVEPTGNFVSSHHVTSISNLSSTCNSTPGATCKISFTKDGITKSLPTKTLDDGGAAYWSWRTSDIGLTQGNWNVKATVKLGDQSKSATDALVLEVK
jgi:hypothetical protein